MLAPIVGDYRLSLPHSARSASRLDTVVEFSQFLGDVIGPLPKARHVQRAEVSQHLANADPWVALGLSGG